MKGVHSHSEAEVMICIYLITNVTCKLKEEKVVLKRMGKEFQIVMFGFVFIVIQTANEFSKITKQIIIWNIIQK